VPVGERDRDAVARGVTTRGIVARRWHAARECTRREPAVRDAAP